MFMLVSSHTSKQATDMNQSKYLYFLHVL